MSMVLLADMSTEDQVIICDLNDVKSFKVFPDVPSDNINKINIIDF